MTTTASILFTSPIDSIPIPDQTLPEMIGERAKAYGASAALIDATTGTTMTYAELAIGIDQVAAALAARGLRPGDVVALISANCIEYPLASLGVMAAGGVVTGVNPAYSAEEIAHQLSDSRARTVIVSSLFFETASAAAAACGVTDLIVIGDVPGATSFSSLVDHDHPPVSVDIAPSALAALPYSSGTTGRSKGVCLTHANLVANIVQADAAFPLTSDDQVMVFLPMFHIFGFSIITMGGLAGGATLITVPMFEPHQFCETIQNHRINKLYVVPPIMNFLAGHPLVDQYDLSSVEVLGCGAAPLGASMEHAVANRLGCLVGQGFGMTEVSGAATMPRFAEDATPHLRAGSSGQLVPNMEALVVDPETGVSLGHNETGELWLRGPNCFAVYLDNPAASAATVDSDGWLHTGDLCHFDEDGFLYVTDRLKELIKVKGFQVAPAELEALVLEHPAVADVAVVGRADERSGEVPVAYVVAHGDIDVDDVRSFVANRVSDYKHLAEVIVIDAIPKNPSGKILRRELRGS